MSGCLLQCKGKVGGGGNPRGRLVPYQPRQFSQRPNLCGSAQITLVDEALLVERQDVEHDRSGIEQGDGKVVIGAGLQGLQGGIIGTRKPREHRLLERGPRADSICERIEARPIAFELRRLHAGPGAASAEATRGSGAAHVLLTALHQQRELAVIGKIAIVVEPRDLKLR